MQNQSTHSGRSRENHPFSAWFPSHVLMGLVLAISLLAGCGGGAQYAKVDTPEGEAFLKKTKQAWEEVQALIDPNNQQSSIVLRNPKLVHGKITSVMQESSETFQTLIKTKKISKSQCDRYLAMIEKFAKN